MKEDGQALMLMRINKRKEAKLSGTDQDLLGRGAPMDPPIIVEGGGGHQAREWRNILFIAAVLLFASNLSRSLTLCA